MPAPFRLSCCLCRRPIPLSSDVYALDAEWQRRFPDMAGVLACGRCAAGPTYFWRCTTSSGEYVAGHRAVADADEHEDFDSWCHVEAFGTHKALVLSYPESAVRQGAEQWLRQVLQRPRLDRDVVERIRQALADRDAQGA